MSKIERQFLTGQVVRYHCNPIMSRARQTNADHQWGVAILIYNLHPNPSRNLIHAALTHDAGEIDAGDVPYPTKVKHPEHAANHDNVEMEMRRGRGFPDIELTEKEKKYLHLADRLESYLYMKLCGELRQWNITHMQEILSLAKDLGCASQVMDAFQQEEN